MPHEAGIMAHAAPLMDNGCQTAESTEEVHGNRLDPRLMADANESTACNDGKQMD